MNQFKKANSREKNFLISRYRKILSSIGIILIISSFIVFLPLLIIPFYPEELKNILAFIIPAFAQCITGFVFWKFFSRKDEPSLSFQESGVIIMTSWIAVLLTSSIPFISLSKLSFPQALFESVSGWTTTGLSVINVGEASKMILLWRSIMQLAGGAGLAIIMISSLLNTANVSLSNAEGRSDQLVPNIRKSARLVLAIYVSYAVLGIFLYNLAGMSFIDSVNHSFTAISTGGFSTKTESIGHWNSIYIEVVTIILMLLGNTSFVTAWLIFKGKFKKVFRNGELRLLVILIPLSVSTLIFLTTKNLYPNFSNAIRIGFFETITAITTTGFSTVSYSNWNSYGLLLLIVLMLIGGGIFSTAGGIKQFRIYFLIISSLREIKRHISPKYAILQQPIWEGDRITFVTDNRICQVGFFVFTYLATYFIGSLILCACGFGLRDSMFEFASALGTVGLSIGITSANMPATALWAELIAMFLGRLEIVVVLTSLIKLYRDGLIIIKKRI